LAGTNRVTSGREFPVLPFLAAICYKIVGVHEWLERGPSGSYYSRFRYRSFFLLVRNVFEKPLRSWALFLLQLCATRNQWRPMFYAGHPSLALSIIGFISSTLDRGVRTGIACKIDRHFL